MKYNPLVDCYYSAPNDLWNRLPVIIQSTTLFGNMQVIISKEMKCFSHGADCSACLEKNHNKHRLVSTRIKTANDELLSISVWMPGVAIIMHRRKELFVNNATITLTLLFANNMNKSLFYWGINLRDKEENLAEQSQKIIPNIDYVSHCKHCTNGHSLKTKERPVYQSKHSHKGRQERKGIGGFGVPEYLVPYLGCFEGKAS